MKYFAAFLFQLRRSVGLAGLTGVLAAGLLCAAILPAQAQKPFPGELLFGNKSGSDNSSTTQSSPPSVVARPQDMLWNVARPTRGFWASPYGLLIQPLYSAADAEKCAGLIRTLRASANGNRTKFLTLVLAAEAKADSSGLRRCLLLAASRQVNRGGLSADHVQRFAAIFYPAFSQPTLAQAGELAKECATLERLYTHVASQELVGLTVRAWANLAELEVRAGQIHKAAASLQTARRFVVRLSRRRRSLMEPSMRRIGALVLDARKFAQVLPTLEQTLARDPKNRKANTRLTVESLTLLENVPLAATFARNSAGKWLKRLAADYARVKNRDSDAAGNLSLAGDLAHIGMGRWRSTHRFAICSFAHRSLGRILVLENLSDGQSAAAEKQLSALAGAIRRADPAASSASLQ